MASSSRDNLLLKNPDAQGETSAKDRPTTVEDQKRQERDRILFEKDVLDTPFRPRPWSEYPSVGNVIGGTRFICFKVPLTPDKCPNVDKDRLFTPENLFEEFDTMGRSLGLVIDLTNTEQFYNPREVFESRNVTRKTIFCPGRGHVPALDKVTKFEDFVELYIKESKGKLDKFKKEYLIGVMSKQGTNRPAYFICRYLIEKKGWKADDAIKAFETSRGSIIERGSLVTDLYEVEEKEYKRKCRCVDKMIDSTPKIIIKNLPSCLKLKIARQKAHRLSIPPASGIPTKWKRYRPVGCVVENTRFIVFKAPLDKAFFRRQSAEHWFTPELLLTDHIRPMNRTLGMVIDLTNAEDFYPPDFFEPYNIEYRKILCLPIIKTVPIQEKVDMFFCFVNNYLAKTSGKLDKFHAAPLIGIHSTRGVNRASYFLCRYLIEKMGWEPTFAIDAVEEARGCNIERDIIIQFLLKLNKSGETRKSASESSKDATDTAKKADPVPA